MPIGIAIACFVLAALAFLNGLVTEYRQSREKGPIAMVPTLPQAVAAAMWVAIGLLWLPVAIPWWAYLLGFFGSALVFGCLINCAGRRKE